MRKTLKKYFVPHAGNNYHPHILHTKRAILYAAIFVLIKILVVAFALFIPTAVFVLPDVFAEQQSKIIALTNQLRAEKGLPQLVEVGKLDVSSESKANDMATRSYFSHTNPDGHKLAYFLNQVGYKYSVAGENLALGFSAASDVVDAWIKSPTHYSNLVDVDFQEIGVGVESGIYDGQPTVYVAEHFGTPEVKTAITQPKPVAAAMVKAEEQPIATNEKQKVAGVEISQPVALARVLVAPKPTSVVYNRENSKVYWEEKNGETVLTVEAEISGNVKTAEATVNGYPIDLKTDGNSSYFGSLTVHEPADNFFKVIISPTINIMGKDGTVIKDNIDWDKIKIVSPTPIQKYVYARTWLGKYFSIFAVSKNIYLFFIIFFSIALAINILVEIKKQHHHIIIQTLALLGLLACLFVI